MEVCSIQIVVLVGKVILTDNSDITNKIIHGTNWQNIVYDEAFECTLANLEKGRYGRMGRKAKELFKTMVRLQLAFLRKVSPSMRLDSRFVEYCLAEQEKGAKEYLSVYRYPKYLANVVSIEEDSDIQHKSAVVMQGPLVTEDNFTLNTVRIYRKLFPGVLAVVSTWEGEDEDTIAKLKKEPNCLVVCSKEPDYSGILNLNYQITSTMAGIREAGNAGREYIFKGRNDNRIYTKGIFEFLYSALQSYPVDDSVTYQKYRIVAGGESINSMFRPFWLTDQYGYGYIEDMLKYWDYSQKDTNLSVDAAWKEIVDKNMTWNERTKAGLGAEPCIFQDFFERMENQTPECTVKNYWEIIKKQFITMSRADVGLFWFKYDVRHDECRRQGLYFLEDDATKCMSYNWDFLHWLLLYNGGLKYKETYEQPANVTRYKRKGVV